MFGLFGKSTFLDADVEDWVFETWAWLMREFGGMAQMRWTKLAVPTPEFFPVTTTEGEDRAAYLFERVKALMSMADRPCDLEPCAPPPATIGVVGQHGMARSKGVPGRFHMSGLKAVIGYDPDLIDKPMALVAVFAHELSRYRLTKAHTAAPGGSEVKELTAELGVAFAGMGLFNANVAYDFHASPGGNYGGAWGSESTGYFSEETWAFAIALFCALKGIEPPVDHLKDSIAGLAKNAAHYLERNSDKVAALRAAR